MHPWKLQNAPLIEYPTKQFGQFLSQFGPSIFADFTWNWIIRCLSINVEVDGFLSSWTDGQHVRVSLIYIWGKRLIVVSLTDDGLLIMLLKCSTQRYIIFPPLSAEMFYPALHYFPPVCYQEAAICIQQMGNTKRGLAIYFMKWYLNIDDDSFSVTSMFYFVLQAR